MGHHHDLAEPPPESLEGEQHALLAILVEGPEDLVEHQQAHRSTGLEAHLFADRHPQ